MSEIRYTKDHEWVRLEGAVAVVGITEHAQEALGDLVFIELPEAGRRVAAGEACAVIESVKAASDIYAPLAGVVTEINAALADDPTLVNPAAEAAGWLFRMTPDNATQFGGLLDSAGYAALLAAE